MTSPQFLPLPREWRIRAFL